MQQIKQTTLQELKGELLTYFNWSINALVPLNPWAADRFLEANRNSITRVAQQLLQKINYTSSPIYRGIILKQPVEQLMPHKNLQYLSFSVDRAVAEHFANVNGFGSEIINMESRLGKYGYVVTYTPRYDEILFHHDFLLILPYADALTRFGFNGNLEVHGLQQQKEVMILQPTQPLTHLTSNQQLPNN
ncbi:MAG: hypothetical protein E6Q24_04960 [Chitinophagaceae bacterium]|nr:MAG: hypothetical protein E6Q24_04960 [Chitinophagaceae bacterium]